MEDQWVCFGEKQESTCLFVPDADFIRAGHAAEADAPYWAQVWPASIAMYRFLKAHPDYIREKTVIELAAGLGLPSLFAARYATSVICSDLDAEAIRYCQRSAENSGLTNFHTAQLDWNSLPEDLHADVILLSDVNYEPSEFENLSAVVEGFLKAGTTILLSTPQRLMAKPFIAQWLPWCELQEEFQVNSQGKTSLVSVFVLSGT